MKILFLTNLLPLPLDNGGKIKTYTTLCGLHQGGHQIDLLCFTEEKKVDKDIIYELGKICSSINTIYLKLTSSTNKVYMFMILLKSLLSKYPFGIYKYISKEMKEYIKNYIKNKSYDVIYYDHLQLSVYKPLFSNLGQPVCHILDEHNCETILVEQKKGKMPGRLFFFIEAKKYRNFERVAILSMNKTFVLSKEDYQNLKLITGRKFSHRIIPIGISDRGIKKDREEDGILNMLFLGTLTWEPNNRGIIWFLKNIMPKLNEKYKKLNLYIVGKTPSNELKNIATKFNNVVITGYVESVDEYYNKSDFMIVPLFTGSGQRVKIIEAFSKGMPVISTTLGAEGLFSTDGIDILIADTKKEFYDKIQALTKSSLRKKISINSRKLYEQYYSIQSVGKR